jgi:uncharacterized protein (TIGR02231 family)
MKKILIVLILSYALQINAQSVKEIRADINHVTVFPDRAQLDYEFPVTITQGKTLLKLSGLSPYIDPQSIQVKGFGEFTILSVNHQNNYLENLEDQASSKSIAGQIEALQVKAEDEKAAIRVLKEKESFLLANKTVLIKETTITAEHFKNVMDLYTANIDQVTMATLKKERLIKEYEKQISLLQQQLARPASQQLPSGEVSVLVTSEKQISGKMTLNYIVSNAGWYPSYDIRVDDIKNPVNIFYKANVYQSSGTVWKDVKLSFSNATPWISGDIPVLYPWFIDYFTPPVAVPYGARRSKAPVMAESMDAPQTQVNKELAVEEAMPVMVQKQVGTTTITYDVAVPYTIPSDGKMQAVEIQRLKAPSTYKYVTLPKLSRFAYLTANIVGWADLSLQNGEANLYFENSFVSKTSLNADQLTDTFALSLGNDNSILVKREKRTDYTSKKVIGSNKTETFSFQITIRNNKSIPVRITINDQIPVSSNNGITVEPLELSGGKHNEQTGEIRWDLDINQQETKQLVLTYTVKYPKDKIVITD